MTHNPSSGPINPTTRALIHETIAIRAYELWESHGKPGDEALDNWLEAERELLTGKRERRFIPIHALE